MDARETIVKLREALAGLEAGEGPAGFVEGHGLQSHAFRFRWSGDALSIDFDLPCGRVLSSEEDQAADDARIGAAIRMAMLLLMALGDGTLLQDDEAAISISADKFGDRYSIYAKDGEIMDSGDDWNPLITRFKANTAASNLEVIWP